ncbi:hypothetical protein PENTCL1PPCAC_17460, partial [Pristionchus entomophagus]
KASGAILMLAAAASDLLSMHDHVYPRVRVREAYMKTRPPYGNIRAFINAVLRMMKSVGWSEELPRNRDSHQGDRRLQDKLNAHQVKEYMELFDPLEEESTLDWPIKEEGTSSILNSQGDNAHSTSNWNESTEGNLLDKAEEHAILMLAATVSDLLSLRENEKRKGMKGPTKEFSKKDGGIYCSEECTDRKLQSRRFIASKNGIPSIRTWSTSVD